MKICTAVRASCTAAAAAVLVLKPPAGCVPHVPASVPVLECGSGGMRSVAVHIHPNGPTSQGAKHWVRYALNPRGSQTATRLRDIVVRPPAEVAAVCSAIAAAQSLEGVPKSVPLVGFATAGMRRALEEGSVTAEQLASFERALQSALGGRMVQIRVISGEEEARYEWESVQHNGAAERVVGMVSGGGVSFQLAYQRPDGSPRVQSFQYPDCCTMVDRNNFYGKLTAAWRNGEPVSDDYFKQHYPEAKAAVRAMMQQQVRLAAPLDGRFALIEVARGYADGFGGRFPAAKSTATAEFEIRVEDLSRQLDKLEQDRFNASHIRSASVDIHMLRLAIACEVLEQIFTPQAVLVQIRTGETGPHIGLALEAYSHL